MILCKHISKKKKELWEIPDLDVILKFYESEWFLDKRKIMDQDVCFALFLGSKEPKGLNSTVSKDEFNRVYPMVDENKWRRIKDIPPELKRKY